MRTNQAGAYTAADLIFAATSRCPCGAGLAYPRDAGMHGAWDCSAILTGTAATDVKHTAELPFAFYEIKSEQQPSANGATTRPEEDEAAKGAREIAELKDEIRRADRLSAHLDDQQRKIDAERATWTEKRAAAVKKLGELGVTVEF